MNNYNVYTKQQQLQAHLYPLCNTKRMDDLNFQAVDMILAGKDTETVVKATGLSATRIIELRKQCHKSNQVLLPRLTKEEVDMKNSISSSQKTNEAVSYWMTRITDPSAMVDEFGPGFSGERLRQQMIKFKEEEKVKSNIVGGYVVKRSSEIKEPVYTSVYCNGIETTSVSKKEPRLFQIQEPNKTIIGITSKKDDEGLDHFYGRAEDDDEPVIPEWWQEMTKSKFGKNKHGIYHCSIVDEEGIVDLSDIKSMVDHEAIKAIPEATVDEFVESKKTDAQKFWSRSSKRYKKNRSYGINYDLDIFGQPIKIKKAAKTEVGMTLEDMMIKIDEEEMGRNKIGQANNIVEVLEVL